MELPLQVLVLGHQRDLRLQVPVDRPVPEIWRANESEARHAFTCWIQPQTCGGWQRKKKHISHRISKEKPVLSFHVINLIVREITSQQAKQKWKKKMYGARHLPAHTHTGLHFAAVSWQGVQQDLQSLDCQVQPVSPKFRDTWAPVLCNRESRRGTKELFTHSLLSSCPGPVIWTAGLVLSGPHLHSPYYWTSFKSWSKKKKKKKKEAAAQTRPGIGNLFTATWARKPTAGSPLCYKREKETCAEREKNLSPHLLKTLQNKTARD